MYLEVYRPTSRVEIWRTDRYEKAEGFHELGVFATSVIPQGEILYEIQGQCADLPDEWSNSDEEDSDDTSGSDRDKPEDGPARVRRCAIKGRRDFSIISSTRYAKTQLFLGPARFINVRGVVVWKFRPFLTPLARLRAQRRVDVAAKEPRLVSHATPDYDRRGVDYDLVGIVFILL